MKQTFYQTVEVLKIMESEKDCFPAAYADDFTIIISYLDNNTLQNRV